MATILKKLPDVIGFYMPGDRRQDFDNLTEDLRTGELRPEPSMTKQAFIAECDINNIVREFTPQAMAELTLLNFQSGKFQDLPDLTDYQTALEQCRVSQEAFDSLPAKIRARFDNDPAKFIDFFMDPANQDEAIKLGLANDTRAARAPETPQPGPEAPTPPPAPPPPSNGS